MAGAHKLNFARFEKLLTSRGWTLTAREWLTPSEKTRKEIDRDWVECLELAMDCSHEEGVVNVKVAT